MGIDINDFMVRVRDKGIKPLAFYEAEYDRYVAEKDKANQDHRTAATAAAALNAAPPRNVEPVIGRFKVAALAALVTAVSSLFSRKEDPSKTSDAKQNG